MLLVLNYFFHASRCQFFSVSIYSWVSKFYWLEDKSDVFFSHYSKDKKVYRLLFFIVIYGLTAGIMLMLKFNSK